MAGVTARLTQAWDYVRRNAAGAGLEIAINFVAPFLIYDLTKDRLGDVHALMISSAPPIVWSIVEFVRKRRVDALSMMVLAGIALSLLAYLGGGGVKFLQLRERLVTLAIGLSFLVSAAIGRPLIYYLAMAGMRRRNSHDEAAEFESRRHLPFFRRTMLILTLVWGFALVAEAAVSATMVFAVSIKTYFVVGPIIGYSFLGVLSAWTYWFGRRQRRIGAAMRAAADAAATAGAQGTPEAAGAA
jgi:hypothetical protein